MTSLVRHGGTGVFAGVPDPTEATRYHSLMVDEKTLPSDLVVTARSDDGVVMALRHRSLPLEAVQFHPESVMTAAGMRMLENFIGRACAPRRHRRRPHAHARRGPFGHVPSDGGGGVSGSAGRAPR